jgi:hypothetical protein
MMKVDIMARDEGLTLTRMSVIASEIFAQIELHIHIGRATDLYSSASYYEEQED